MSCLCLCVSVYVVVFVVVRCRCLLYLCLFVVSWSSSALFCSWSVLVFVLHCSCFCLALFLFLSGFVFVWFLSLPLSCLVLFVFVLCVSRVVTRKKEEFLGVCSSSCLVCLCLCPLDLDGCLHLVSIFVLSVERVSFILVPHHTSKKKGRETSGHSVLFCLVFFIFNISVLCFVLFFSCFVLSGPVVSCCLVTLLAAPCRVMYFSPIRLCFSSPPINVSCAVCSSSILSLFPLFVQKGHFLWPPLTPPRQ